MPEDTVPMNPVQRQEPVAVAAVTPAPAPSESAIPAQNGTPVWAMGIGIVLVLIVGGAAFSRARRKQTDKTPPPRGFTFNGGEDNGRNG